MDLFERIRREKLLSDMDLQKARSRVIASHEDWGTAIWALKLVPERAIVRLLAAHTDYPGVELGRSIMPLANLALFPEEMLRRKRVLPLVDSHGGLVLAMADPDDDALVNELAFMSGRKILRHVAIPGALKQALDQALAQNPDEVFWKGREVWQLSPGPEGRVAVVHPDERPAPPASAREGMPEIDLEASDEDASLPIVLGREIDPDAPGELELVGLLDPAFEVQELPPRPAAPKSPSDAKTTQRLGLGAGKVVLIVDDDEAMRSLHKKVLEPFGCALLETGDGKEALALARDARPDLMILDAMLPGMHGFEVCRAIKGDPELRRTAVLIVSGIHTRWNVGVDVAEVYGADGFFAKPFRVDELGRAVRRCLMLGGGGEEALAKARRQAALDACREAAARGKAGKLREAVDLLRSATAKDPYSVEPHFYLGQALRAAGEPYQALASLERAVDLRPDHDQPLVALGDLYKQLGFRKTALQVFQRALEVCTEPRRRAHVEEQVRELAQATAR